MSGRTQALSDLDLVDRAVYEAIAAAPTPSLDVALARLSGAADHSKLWLLGTAVLATVGGRRGRQAARMAVASIALSSAFTNLVAKPLLPRRRPDRVAATVPPQRWVRMPASLSFPSGHSASAFAFATSVGSVIPAASLPLHLVAAAVAYSRVHTGVHYPADAIIGAMIGTAAGTVVHRIIRT